MLETGSVPPSTNPAGEAPAPRSPARDTTQTYVRLAEQEAMGATPLARSARPGLLASLRHLLDRLRPHPTH